MHIFQASNLLYSRCETNVSGLPHYTWWFTQTHTHTHTRRQTQTDRHWRTDGRTDKLLDTAVAHAGVAYTVRRASSLTHSLIHSLAAFNLHSNILHWLWLITAASVICVMARRTRCETLRLVARQCCHRDGLRETHPKYKNVVFRVWASYKPTPVP